jgi:hypothetical protein
MSGTIHGGGVAPFACSQPQRCSHNRTENVIPLKYYRSKVPRWFSFQASWDAHSVFEGAIPFEVSFPKVRTGHFSATFDEFARGWDQSLFANSSWNPADYFT